MTATRVELETKLKALLKDGRPIQDTIGACERDWEAVAASLADWLAQELTPEEDGDIPSGYDAPRSNQADGAA